MSVWGVSAANATSMLSMVHVLLLSLLLILSPTICKVWKLGIVLGDTGDIVLGYEA